MKRANLLVIGVSALLAISMLVLALTVGCTRVNNIAKPTDTGVKKVEPWPTASAELAHQQDTPTARRVLNQLNLDLETANESLPLMSPEGAKALAAKIAAVPDEVVEWEAKAYTPMDENYMGECLFLHAVAKNLELDGLPEEEKARAMFEWVCRQMYPRQWVFGQPRPPVPPQDSLHRGYGTGLERAYVVLALARQFGLDAVLVGQPNSERKVAWDHKQPGNRGPFWAVGIRTGDDVLLMDPWLGEVIPSADGKSIAKLSAVKANYSFVQAWYEAKKLPNAPKPEEIFKSVAYVSVPVNALTPRMKTLETKLASEVGVKLAVNAEELEKRTANLPGGAARWFAPPREVDAFSPPHILGTFTPKDDGGYNTAPPAQQISVIHAQAASIMPTHFPPPEALKTANGKQAFQEECWNHYRQMLVEPGFRDRILRGQHTDTLHQLVDLDRDFSSLRKQLMLPSETSRAVSQWYMIANDVYEQARRAMLPENAANQPGVQLQLKQLWGQNSPGHLAVRGAIAEIALHEIAFLLAVCKHEIAELARVRHLKAPTAANANQARAEWRAARSAWASYREKAEQFETVFPGRAAHAKVLAQRAETFAK